MLSLPAVPLRSASGDPLIHRNARDLSRHGRKSSGRRQIVQDMVVDGIPVRCWQVEIGLVYEDGMYGAGTSPQNLMMSKKNCALSASASPCSLLRACFVVIGPVVV